MYYVYVLVGTSNPSYYIGYTSDLKQRLRAHNAGNNQSTKRGRPWKLVYCEGYTVEDIARQRERAYKQRGKAWQQLKRRIANH